MTGNDDGPIHDYTVTWAIEIAASSPEDAARQARAIQRDPASRAGYFTVTDDTDGEETGVYLGT